MSQDHFISNGRHFFRWIIFVSSALYFLYFTQLLVYTQQRHQMMTSSSNNHVKIDHSRCCVRPSSPMIKDVCGRENCTEDCPDPVRLPIDTGRENAFFLETSGSGTLNIRQACAVESLAYHNPNLNVNVLFVGGHINAISSNTTQKLADTYTNLHLIGVDLDEYLAGTALEKWYHCTDWRNGPYHVSHLSDGLRFLTLNKFGGYYFDLDVLIVKSVIDYRNFVAVESRNDMGSGVIHAEMGSPLMKLSVKDFADNYSAGLWTHNGPLLLFRVLKSWCNVKDLQSMDYIRCHGFHVLPQTSFCPVHYTNLGKLFNNNHPSSSPDNNNTVVDWLTDQVVGIHTWNKLSYNRPIYKNSSQTYTRLARDHCPLIYSMAPDVF